MTFDPENTPRPRRTPNRPDAGPPGANPPARRAPRRPAQSRALTGEVLPPPVPGDQPYYEPMPQPAQEGLLKNPYVLAALAVAGAIVLAVFVVVLSGGSGGGGSDNGDNGVVIDPLTPLPGRGIAARSIATSTVREGPSIEYLEIGLLRANQDVEVVGRNADSSWFQIFYPPRSQLRGWVSQSALRVPETSIAGLPVVAVTPIPRPTVPTPTPEPVPTDTPTPTATPPGTGTPGSSGPDLAISFLDNTCQAGQQVAVTVRNAGTVPLTNRQIRITVSTPSGVLSTSAFSISIEPGATVNLPTNATVQPPRTTVRLELIGSPSDGNNANNAVDCAIAGSPGTPTPAGTAVPPPIGSPAPTRTPGP